MATLRQAHPYICGSAIAIYLIAFWYPALAGASQPAVTEAEVVERALQRAPAVQALLTRADATSRSADGQGGLPAPMFRLTISELGIPADMQPTAWVMAEQPLPLGGQQTAPIKAAKAAATAIRTEAPVIAGEIAYSARLAFAAWRGAVRRVAALAHHVQMASDVAQVLVRSMAAGKSISAARLAQTQADVALLQADLDAARAALPGLRQQVAAWTGLDAAELPEPALQLPVSATESSPLDQHPAIARLRAQQAVLTAQADAERAAAGWTLTPGLGVMTMAGMPLAVMASLGVRVGNFPAGPAARTAARIEGIHGNRVAIDHQVMDKTLRIKAKMAAVDSEMDQLAARRQAIESRVLPALRHAIVATLPGLAGGSASVVDVVEAEHRLATLDLQVVDLETQWLQARARRLRLETGDADDMGGAGAGGPMGAAMSDATMGPSMPSH